AIVFDDLVRQPRKECRPIVVIILSPPIRGMVMTFGTLQARPEEYLRGRLAPGKWVAVGTVVIGRRLRVGAAARGDQLPHELIDGRVICNALPNPMVKGLDPLLIQRMCFHPEQVGPLQRPEVVKLGPLEQAVYETSPLVGPLLSQERPRFLRRRKLAE